MSSGARMLALSTALGLGLACSVVLDFELEVECWCGERWIAQISGAEAILTTGSRSPIDATDTTHEVCVTQLEHLALAAANPGDPLYQALRTTLESGAVANCETSGALNLGFLFDGTTCATTGTLPVTTNITHLGPCWDLEVVPLDEPEPCSLDSQCGEFYDCTNEPIVSVGDDEAGDELLWDCAPQ